MTGAGVGICIDKAVDDGVVVAALEVIPSRFCLILVPATPKNGAISAASMSRVPALLRQVPLPQNWFCGLTQGTVPLCHLLT